MARLQVMDAPLPMVFHPSFYHVCHNRDNHACEYDDSSHINQACQKHRSTANILTDIKIAKRITINQQIQREHPFADIVFFAIVLPIATRQ